MTVQEALQQRYSCRIFLDAPVERGTLDAIFQDAFRTPSWANSQPWDVYVAGQEEMQAIVQGMQECRKQRLHTHLDLPFQGTWSAAAKGHMDRFFEEVYADSYIEEEKLAVWTPVSDPPCKEKFAGQVVGGEICAWGIRGHFDYTLPVNFFLFADRLRNREPLDREAAQAALTRQLVSNEKGFPNIFRLLGGSIMPLDGIKKYRSAGNADKKSAEEAVEKVERKLSEGRGCRALLRGLVSCLEELRNDLG